MAIKEDLLDATMVFEIWLLASDSGSKKRAAENEGNQLP
jgi:hypothetical protein